MNSGGDIAKREASRYISIYQVSWIKIKKKLFLNKRRHSEFVYVAIDCVSGITFYDFVANSVRTEIFFLPTSKRRQAKFCLFLGICWCSSSFTAKISSFETVAKREAILSPCYWCGAYTRAALIRERRLFQLLVKY